MGRAVLVERADEVLRRFFTERRERTAPRRAARIGSAETALHDCLDALAPHVLTRQESALLALERQFEPIGATARVATPAALLLVLPVYLHEPRWHGADLEDRMLRIRLAEWLMEEVVHSPGVGDVGRAAWTVDAAVRHETWMLRQEREASRSR